MIQTIDVNLSDPYTIYLGAGILNTFDWPSVCRQYAERVVIISDDTMHAHYQETILNLFATVKPLWLTFPAGEEYKTRETKALLEDKMQAAGCNRDTCVIAIGGGVVCDLAGFIAATYCRGVPVIYLPTTLLAMVDASVGGKTGVNTAFSKNSIGAFYQPKVVFIDIDFLKQLPNAELKNGLAEIVKHALIKDKKQLQRLLNFQQSHPGERWLLSDATWLLETITASITIKKDVVVCDEKEAGLRQILNFGHTFGHVIEALSDYRVAHGQAVAIGMYLESYVSYRYGKLSHHDFSTIESSLRTFQFDLNTPYFCDPNKISQTLTCDKKSRHNEWRMVFLDAIGQVCPHYVAAFGMNELQDTLAWYRGIYAG